jgi:hypothetical protein
VILSLETLEECEDAKTILVERHQLAQSEVGKYITQRNLARKGNSVFKYEQELIEAEEFLQAVRDAIRFVQERIQQIKFAGMSEATFIIRAVESIYGAEGRIKVLEEMNKIREQARERTANRPGLALEPTGNARVMRIRYV